MKAIQEQEKAIGERSEDLGPKIQAALGAGRRRSERQLVARQGVVL